MKKILYFVVIAIIIALSAMVVFFDDIAKSTLESYAQKSLNTPVEITELRSDWSTGKINLDFIEVKNPANFSNENAFVLNHLSADLATEQQGKLIIVDRLEFDGLLFTLEQNKGQVNLVELLKKLDRQPKLKQSPDITSPIGGKLSDESAPYRLRVNQLSFINTQLFVDTQWFKETVEVPNIIIHQFGREQGIPIDQVGAELMKIALTRIQSEVEKNGLRLSEQEIKEGVRRQLRGKLDELSGDLDNKAKNWLKKLGL